MTVIPSTNEIAMFLAGVLTGATLRLREILKILEGGHHE